MSAPPIAVRLKAVSRASLEQAWSTFADSDRFNRLAGLDFRFEYDFTQAGRAQGTGQYRHLGMQLTWREVPVVFEAPRHFAIERLYDNGPIDRAVTELRLTEVADGTQIEMDTLLWSRQPLLRAAVAVDAELTLKPKMTKAFQTLVRALHTGGETPDLAPPTLSRAAEAQLKAALPNVRDAEVEAQLGAFLRAAPLVEQARLRPVQLAKRWRLPERQVTAGLLRAAQAGLLQVQWEMLCPSCKMPTANPEKLDLAKVSAHCTVCDVRYDASFADSIGLSLKPAAAIRSDLGQMRCLSSPARMPHLLGQCQVAPRQEHSWTLDLLPGTYRLRGWPQLEPLVVVVRSEATRREQSVQAGPQAMSPPIVRLASGRVTLQVRSKLDVPLTLVLERPGVEPATLTVGRLLEWPEVAQLLPAGSLDTGVQLQPLVSWATAVRVERGGPVAEQAAGDAVRALGPRALQVSTGWVLATWPGADQAAAAVAKLQGTPWLAGAIGCGAVLEMFSDGGENGGRRVASGAVLHELTALAQQAEPGQWLALQAAAWPEPLAKLIRAQTSNGTITLRPATPATPLPPPGSPQRPLSTGDVLDGRFVIGEPIGQGGFGVVYLAQDRLRGGEVVVKLLRSELASDPVQV
ncbi:MAG: SRPBCC family protein, partial [Deltaproteobacteria bacterium]|nr:SRPBCC family protein [Deltaproteobacteria bacterium]